MSIVFISHALENPGYCRSNYHLRDGKHVVTESRNSRARIVQAMVGRDLSNTLYGTRKSTVAAARAGADRAKSQDGPMVRNNSLRFCGQYGVSAWWPPAARDLKVVAGV